ncbi:TonB-dependent receptor plug domain-containing protein [Flavobacterium sp. NST-5]|uniref:TonB-dependent receptor plug domain-containing protein n=1 Tax=Flavobacterium ichthyis TaxID=2698827 RepID=A0ABW9Z7P6_9FLAO|nr:TonB-dependent receptor plug domain-containing protein [Flavobacterium ichthyis]NBL64893.1 TonB-dependent receptor plug domain-containing protein [Flavobacterium ichthyis]
MAMFTANAQTARIKGVILDELQKPVADVAVTAGSNSATSNENGFYLITVPANQKIAVVFSHVSNKPASVTLELKPNEDYEFNPVLSKNVEMIGTIEIYNNRKRVEGITNISPKEIKLIPGANAGVENILKTLPGVNSNSELSTQYTVRGGNFDENLVYVNEIEIYRPFLIRSGQQEGLSFTNTDMVQNVDFSAGGFQAKYGDKLSSVLDISYRRPRSFGASLEASLLGGSLTVESATKNQKLSGIVGLRYRDNSLLVNSQETETNFRPTFADIQTYITYNPSSKWEWSFLGNISQNKYRYEPKTRQTNFGTIDDPKALLVVYEGQENDQYETYFGAIKSVFQPNENFTLKFIASAYNTQEQEHFDIQSNYSFGEIDTNIGSGSLGDVVFTQEIGSQLNHARNDLDGLIVNAEVKGFHNIKNNELEWGFKYTREDMRDRLVEWEVIDSAGFSLNPPIVDLPTNDQPYNPYVGPLLPYQNVRAFNEVVINRLSGYVQWSKKDMIGNNTVWYNVGIRAHNWQVENGDVKGKSQTTFSPRAQFAIKPSWANTDMVFRLSGGLYHQPPFYRELRGFDGNVNPDVKAQQSVHVVLSNDYSFKMWNRPFKFVSEAYYKAMSDVNTYTIENVRIRYRANNEAEAYAAGFDARLNGEFVPGTESWFSFGYMKTEENQNDRGYIARPTDQRLKFGILFQDYVEKIPNLKLYLNLVYNTGLPGGSPSYADPYQYQNRLRDYRRADVGFSYVLTENNDQRPDGHWLKKFKDLSLGFEIFNLFNNQNAITNTWVRDTYTKIQYGIPNYMTTRVFNVKLTAKL